MFGELQPWIVGDSSTLATWENDQEAKIWEMIDYFKYNHPYDYVRAQDIDNMMDQLGIDYPNLPQFLKDLIDEIDIV